MKKIFKCEFKFQNLTTRNWVSVFFYLEGDDKFAIERIAIVNACDELKGQIRNYQLLYYRVEETQQSKENAN
jgi:hypothetical protein